MKSDCRYMKQYIFTKLFVVIVLLVFASCKKDDTTSTLDFLIVNDYRTFPDTVVFKAISNGENVDLTEWNFGDGSSAVGQEVQHIYNSQGCFDVSCSYSNLNQTKRIKISRYKKYTITFMDVLAIPLYNTNQELWDINSDADLTFSLFNENQNVYTSSQIISNSNSGHFVLSPVYTNNDIESNVVFKVYDNDPNEIPNLANIGYCNFNPCPPIVPSQIGATADTAIVQNGALKIKINFVWY